jgi:hypothetical protein
VPATHQDGVTFLMSTFGRIVWLGFLFLTLGGGMFLATWEIPPPTARVERILVVDQFPR